MNYLAVKHPRYSAVIPYNTKIEKKALVNEYKSKYPGMSFVSYTEKEKKEALAFAGVDDISKVLSAESNTDSKSGFVSFTNVLNQMKELGYDYTAIKLTNGAQYCIWLRDFIYWPERDLVAQELYLCPDDFKIKIQWNEKPIAQYVSFSDFDWKLESLWEDLIEDYPSRFANKPKSELIEEVLEQIYIEYDKRKKSSGSIYSPYYDRYSNSDHLFGVIFANKFEGYGNFVLFENVFESVDEHALNVIDTKGFKKNVSINITQICAIVPYRARTKIANKNWLDVIIKMEKAGRII